MLTVIVILKTLIAVAGLALLGKGILYLLAGAGRETNIFYRVLQTLSRPAIAAVRVITPRRFVPDQYIGFAAFFLLAGLYIALVIQQTALCVQDLKHSACERLLIDYQARCESGQPDACGRLTQSGIAAPPSPGTGANRPR